MARGDCGACTSTPVLLVVVRHMVSERVGDRGGSRGRRCLWVRLLSCACRGGCGLGWQRVLFGMGLLWRWLL